MEFGRRDLQQPVRAIGVLADAVGLGARRAALNLRDHHRMDAQRAHRFFGRRILDAIIDLPFALPTAVASLSFATLYRPNSGWIGSFGHHVVELLNSLGLAASRIDARLAQHPRRQHQVGHRHRC